MHPTSARRVYASLTQAEVFDLKPDDIYCFAVYVGGGLRATAI